MFVAGFDNFADRRREFAAPLNASSRVTDVFDYFVWVLFQNDAELRLEAIRISELINSICGENCDLAAYYQSHPTVRGPRGLGGGMQ